MAVGNQSRHRSSNILIIGGGPAGSAAAIWCAKFNLNVTLLESINFPRNMPGETLHPGAETLFDQLGVADDVISANFLRHTCTFVHWGNDTKLTLFGVDENGQWAGYQIRRADLDNILLAQAYKLGVTILQPCKARDIIVENKKVIGIKTPEKEFQADFTIDAAGGGHWLARGCSFTIRKYSPQLFVQYGYAKGECPSRNESPLIRAIPDGWLWTARVQKNIYQWTKLSFNKAFVAHSWLPYEFRNLEAIEPIGSADVTWRRVIEAAGSGYFMVGDAAFVLDPCSSHGVLKALMSGIMAANAIIKVSNEGFSDEIASRYYNQWISRWFLHDLQRLRQFYRHHPNPPKWI